MSLRMRLFDSPAGSDVGCDVSCDDIEAVLTPCGKWDKSMDSGIGSGATYSIELPRRKLSRRHSSNDVKKSLFSSKRPADTDIEEDEFPSRKRCRDSLPGNCVLESPSQSQIANAVERLESLDLIADGSGEYTLPTVTGKHSDLKSISSDTMVDVIEGICAADYHVTVIDCRYPYEFEGGHIRGAVNLYTKDAVNELLKEPTTSADGKPRMLIFHCEFSSERGPKMYRFLRSQDRAHNQENYPQLNFPEVYLLHGGYKAFYEAHKNLCDPDSYLPMLHEDHAKDLRHFRVKSKSWTVGDKQVTSRRHRSRLSGVSLNFL